MKIEFVDNWWDSWRWLSVQLGAVAGIVSGTLIAAWPVVQWALDGFIPSNPLARAGVALVAVLITFGVPTFARLLKQGGADGASTTTSD